MRTQRSKTDHDLKRSMSPITLGIVFFPVVAFAVSCKPAQTRPVDTHHQGGRNLMNEACRLAATVRPSTSAVPRNAPAPGQS
jgi:hypothetical protein